MLPAVYRIYRAGEWFLPCQWFEDDCRKRVYEERASGQSDLRWAGGWELAGLAPSRAWVCGPMRTHLCDTVMPCPIQGRAKQWRFSASPALCAVGFQGALWVSTGRAKWMLGASSRLCAATGPSLSPY